MTLEQLAAWLHSLIQEHALYLNYVETYDPNAHDTRVDVTINFKSLALAIAEKCPFEVRL